MRELIIEKEVTIGKVILEKGDKVQVTDSKQLAESRMGDMRNKINGDISDMYDAMTELRSATTMLIEIVKSPSVNFGDERDQRFADSQIEMIQEIIKEWF